ncbi:MAG: putative sulfate exporter family transporter [Rhizobiales bacterium]|nr:putative sulfate exporter family transporter [Hyphomicrobiales bacterium]
MNDPRPARAGPAAAALGLAPGLALSVAAALLAVGAQRLELAMIGRAWLEAPVLAILIGAAFRAVVGLSPRLAPGVAFSARILLEIAIVLLGASVDFVALGVAGPGLALWVAGGVVATLAAGYLMGRAFGLGPRLAALVACGDAICGNSAIMAVAPVIGASAAEIGAAIAFTALLGVAVVLLTPLVQIVFALTDRQTGLLAGMTAYAVPQVLAATAAAGPLAAQLGALVKLIRVLMLGPVILIVGAVARAGGGARMRLSTLAPWFVVGFLAMAALRSFGLLPHAAVAPAAAATSALTLVAMAALGLTVDLREAARSGAGVVAAGLCSLAILASIATAMIVALGVR